MIIAFKILLRWCEAVTAILIIRKEVSPQDRVNIRIILKELREEIAVMEKDSRENIR